MKLNKFITIFIFLFTSLVFLEVGIVRVEADTWCANSQVAVMVQYLKPCWVIPRY